MTMIQQGGLRGVGCEGADMRDPTVWEEYEMAALLEVVWFVERVRKPVHLLTDGEQAQLEKFWTEYTTARHRRFDSEDPT